MAWLVFVVSGDGASFRRLKMAVCKFLLEPKQPHVLFHWFPSIGVSMAWRNLLPIARIQVPLLRPHLQ